MRSTLPSTIEIRHRIDVSHDTIMGDPTQVQHHMNLCKNAADAMDAQKAMEVRLSDAALRGSRPAGFKSGEYLELSVRTGHGIPPEWTGCSILFYNEIRWQRKRDGISRARHSEAGGITVTSRVEKGSRFTYTSVHHGSAPMKPTGTIRMPPGKYPPHRR